ncbi:superoxide dismutase [endosymbiont GvMRE of Glomus versiforme]|uniref:superoxide dismutase n=1 Tax=endosymbiont GvMRE of Glomus versiforme TaxID=2039283 RepID=UPI000ED84346|nr:superoxide dismutase [endosymbiont GvMRE of Glomus versiforme]RHZ35762.1 Superoxide dismutase [endosymbiont GvMRE of Glomus versiforme]
MEKKALKTETIYQRVNLDYELKDLEPHIPEVIMNDHYNGNHKGYETNLNLILAKLEKDKKEYIKNNYPDLRSLLQNLDKLSLIPQIKEAIRFQAGGLINHNYFFWHLAKDKTNTSRDFLEALRDSGFDSLDPQSDLKEQLIKQALDPTINGIVYGSYWTWLVLDKNNKMKIIKTPNQDSPWMANLRPLIAIDMWEHAYLRKYNPEQYGVNYKKEYLNALIHYCLNWERIDEIYTQEAKIFG